MRRTLLISLTVLLMAIGAPTLKADVVTLDVSATLTPAVGGGSCSISGCTLGGNIVIDNSLPGPNPFAIKSVDVTISGESPLVGPFTGSFSLGIVSGLTSIGLVDSSFDSLFLDFPTPTPFSLFGYDGGPLDAGTLSSPGPGFSSVTLWTLSTGTLTPVPAPEPSSIALMLAGIGCLLVMRKRIAQGLPIAS
jgi:hypothetical protein